MKKGLTLLATSLILTACAGDYSRQEPPAQKLARTISADAQIGYFNCKADSGRKWECEDKIWKTHTKPESDINTEFVREFLNDAQRYGAEHVLKKMRLPCDTVEGINDHFFSEGVTVSCAGGEKYELVYSANQWNVKREKEAN